MTQNGHFLRNGRMDRKGSIGQLIYPVKKRTYVHASRHAREGAAQQFGRMAHRGANGGANKWAGATAAAGRPPATVESRQGGASLPAGLAFTRRRM